MIEHNISQIEHSLFLADICLNIQCLTKHTWNNVYNILKIKENIDFINQQLLDMANTLPNINSIINKIVFLTEKINKILEIYKKLIKKVYKKEDFI